MAAGIKASSDGLFGTLQVNGADIVTFNDSGNFQINSGYGSVATTYGCRAWVNFNGTGTVAIRASGNVSSITDNGTGDYTVNFTTALPDANYSAIANCNGVPGTSHQPHMWGGGQSSASYTASSVRMSVEQGGVSPQDRDLITVAIFR